MPYGNAFKSQDFRGLWSSLIFHLFFYPAAPILEGEQSEARMTTAVVLRQILLSCCTKYSRNGLQINESFSYHEEVKPGRPQIGVLENDRLNTERFGRHG